MLRVICIVVGVVAIAMGVRALANSRLLLFRTKEITGQRARAVGVATILVGVAIIAFAMMAMPRLINRSRRPSLQASSTSTPQAVAQVAPETDQSQNWKRHATTDEVCSAIFPGTPERSTIHEEVESMERMVCNLPKKKGHYSLNVLWRHEGDSRSSDTYLDDWRDEQLLIPAPDGGQAKLVEEADIEVNGVPGRQIILQVGSSMFALHRVHFLNQRLYHARVIVDPEHRDDEGVRRFLDSVQFNL